MPRSARFRSALAFLAGLLSLSSLDASARTWHLPGQLTSLQMALALADEGDTLRLAPGIYAEPPLRTELGPSMLVLDRMVTIIGEGGEEGRVVLHAGFEGRVMLVEPGASGSTIKGLEFKGGMAHTGGAIHQRGILLELDTCDFRENNAESAGGAIYSERGSLGIRECIFDSNRSGDRGGDLYLEDAAAELVGSTLVGADAEEGGSLYLGPGAHAELRHCLLVAGSATRGGWASVENGFLYADHCTLFGLPGESQSGGLALRGELGSAYLEASILCYSGREAVTSAREGAAMLLCCNLFGNRGGDWQGPVAAQSELGGNLSADPGFCALLRGEFSIGADSPCAPENNPCGLLIGALGVGCPDEFDDEIEIEARRSDGDKN